MPRRDEFAIDGWVVSGYRRRPRYRHRGGRPGWEERRRVIFSLERSGVEPGRPGAIERHRWREKFREPRKEILPHYKIYYMSEAATALDTRPEDIAPEMLDVLEMATKADIAVEEGFFAGLEEQQRRTEPPPEEILKRWKDEWWMLWQKEQDLVRRIARKVQDLETVLSEYYNIVERFNAADADKQGQYRELLNRRRDKVKRLMRQLADWYSRKASMGYTRHKLEVSWRYWDPAWKDRIESWREKEHGLLIYGQDYLRKIRKAKRRR